MSKKENPQLKILRGLLADDYYWQKPGVEPGSVAIGNNFIAWVFPEDKIFISVQGLPHTQNTGINPGKATTILSDSGIHRTLQNGRVIAKLENVDGCIDIYVQRQYLREFPDAHLFTDHSRNFVYARDSFGKLVGIIATVRLSDMEVF